MTQLQLGDFIGALKDMKDSQGMGLTKVTSKEFYPLEPGCNVPLHVMRDNLIALMGATQHTDLSAAASNPKGAVLRDTRRHKPTTLGEVADAARENPVLKAKNDGWKRFRSGRDGKKTTALSIPAHCDPQIPPPGYTLVPGAGGAPDKWVQGGSI